MISTWKFVTPTNFTMDFHDPIQPLGGLAFFKRWTKNAQNCGFPRPNHLGTGPPKNNLELSSFNRWDIGKSPFFLSFDMIPWFKKAPDFGESWNLGNNHLPHLKHLKHLWPVLPSTLSQPSPLSASIKGNPAVMLLDEATSALDTQSISDRLDVRLNFVPNVWMGGKLEAKKYHQLIWEIYGKYINM